MNIKANVGTQGILVAAIGYIQGAAIGGDVKFWATLACAGVMLAISLVAQYRNPDGTHARAAYDPPRKR